MKLIRIFALSLALGMASIVAGPVATAGDAQIDAAIAAGAIGERIDGYLGVVNPAATDAATVRKVQEINNKRRSLYEKLSKDTGTTLAQVARVTGEKQLAKAASGTYIMDDAGSWKKK